MIPTSLDRLLCQRRTLLLQGPMGPFFERLAGALRSHGQQVWKVNFNAGDDWFHRGERVIQFREPMDQWPGRLRRLIAELRLDAIVLFGQSRHMHQAAIAEAQALGVTIFVFEEGYVRPDYVTLEVGGVNAASPLPRDPAFYRQLNASFYAEAPGLPSITDSNRRRAVSLEIPSASAQAASWSSPSRCRRPSPPARASARWPRPPWRIRWRARWGTAGTRTTATTARSRR
jgi:capsular polysaccharide export protein